MIFWSVISGCISEQRWPCPLPDPYICSVIFCRGGSVEHPWHPLDPPLLVYNGSLVPASLLKIVVFLYGLPLAAKLMDCHLLLAIMSINVLKCESQCIIPRYLCPKTLALLHSLPESGITSKPFLSYQNIPPQASYLLHKHS